MKLKGTFPNTSHRLWPAQFATVTLTLASPEVLAVPASAIQTSQAGQHVYVIRADKTAELRPVIIERMYEGLAVISKGLTEGETIVTDGQLRVIPNKPVDVKDPAGTAPKSGKGGEGKAKKKDQEKKAP